MKIKKILSVILVLSLVMLTFYGCKSDSTQETTTAINDSAETEITEAQETTAAVSSSGFYSEAPFDEGSVEKDGDYVTGSYDNPKMYSDTSITINGVNITLPMTLAEISEKTGFEVDLPDNQLQENSTTFLYAKNSNEEQITVHVYNFDASPKAYKDCEVRKISVYQDDVQSASLPCGISVGQKANLNGVINTLGSPEYYTYIGSAEDSTISYKLDNDNNGDFTITLEGNSVYSIDMDVSY
ncbi:MAG: hypothetical protein ACI4IE_02425 [Eubacterium sp.]